MINTLAVSPEAHVKEELFFGKEFNFSYSSLKRLVEAPSLFYKEYVLREKEVSYDKYLLEGVLIHWLLLDGLNFEEKFVVAPDDLPSANSMKVIDAVFKIYQEKILEDPTLNDLELFDFEDEILEILEELNLHQKVGEEKRAAKVADLKGIGFFNHLKSRGKRIIIDSKMLDECTRRADILKDDPDITKLLGMDKDQNEKFGVYNEIDLNCSLKDMPFGLRGILDNLVVDVENKSIVINDFKTTGKSLVHFQDSVEYWLYWLQAAIYKRLAMNFLKDVINDEWSIDFNFIVFDSYNQYYAYPVSYDTMLLWDEMLEGKLSAAEYHYNNRMFDLPFEFVAGNVYL